MRIVLNIICLWALALPGCKDFEIEPQEAWEVTMEGMDMVSIGGSVEVVIHTQEQYDQLIYDRFTKPLEDYWNKHYESVLAGLKERHPGLSDDEYEVLVREIFYSVLPFMGTEGISHPEIDFSRHTLLGKSTFGTGCERPSYQWNINRNDASQITQVNIHVHQHGTCEMGWGKNLWIIVQRFPKTHSVQFATDYTRE